MVFFYKNYWNFRLFFTQQNISGLQLFLLIQKENKSSSISVSSEPKVLTNSNNDQYSFSQIVYVHI